MDSDLLAYTGRRRELTNVNNSFTINNNDNDDSVNSSENSNVIDDNNSEITDEPVSRVVTKTSPHNECSKSVILDDTVS